MARWVCAATLLLALLACAPSRVACQEPDDPHKIAARHAYGHLIVRGAVNRFEYFRATFGAHIPCGARDIVLADDLYACGGAVAPTAGGGNGSSNATAEATPSPTPAPDAAAGTPPSYPLAGKYVVALRGVCTFLQKANWTQSAGAAGLILINNQEGNMRLSVGNATGARDVRIPVVMLPNSTYKAVVGSLQRGVPLHGALSPMRDVCVAGRGQLYVAESGIAAVLRRTKSSLPPPPSGPIVPLAATEDGVLLDEQPGSANATEEAAAVAVTVAGDAAAAAAPADDAAAAAGPPWVPPSSWEPSLTELVAVTLDVSTATAPSPLPAPTAATRPGFEAGLALFSGHIFGVSGRLTFASPPDACGNLTNALPSWSEPTVLVAYRGGCSMVDKARRAEAWGAAGLIIVNLGAEGAKAESWKAALSAFAAGRAAPNITGIGGPLNVTSATASSLPPELLSTPNAPLSLGYIQAIPDDAIKTSPVTIPVAMVAAKHAFHWAWAGGDLTGATVALAPRAGPGSGWEDLAALAVRGPGGSPWSEDRYQRQKTLLGLLRIHHPSSATGDADRFAYLTALVTAIGAGEDLEAVARGAVWVGGADASTHADLGENVAARPIGLSSPASAWVISQMPVLALDRWSPEGLLSACRMEAGTSYTVKIHEPDFTTLSLVNPTRRIADLIQQQACLEKALILNGAAVGAYLSLVRSEATPEDWTRVIRALLKPYRLTDADYARVAAGFTELSQLYDRGRPGLAEAAAEGAPYDAAEKAQEKVSIRDWLEGKKAE